MSTQLFALLLAAIPLVPVPEILHAALKAVVAEAAPECAYLDSKRVADILVMRWVLKEVPRTDRTLSLEERYSRYGSVVRVRHYQNVSDAIRALKQALLEMGGGDGAVPGLGEKSVRLGSKGVAFRIRTYQIEIHTTSEGLTNRIAAAAAPSLLHAE